jgi:hypothetical protein
VGIRGPKSTPYNLETRFLQAQPLWSPQPLEAIASDRIGKYVGLGSISDPREPVRCFSNIISSRSTLLTWKTRRLMASLYWLLGPQGNVALIKALEL